jgi:tRNA pseudouridine55 synthase
MYSAIKINGQKLYNLARKGREVERQPRSITIYELELGHRLSDTDFSLRVLCSKGVYIRTLCHDIGQALGCGGAMAALRRTRVAGFTLDHAVTLDEVQAAADRGLAEELLAPVDGCFSDLPALTLTQPQAKCVRNGRAFTFAAQPGRYRVYSPEGEFLAMVQVSDGTLSTLKSFFEI